MTRKETALKALRREQTERLPAAIFSGGVWLFKRRGMSIGDFLRLPPDEAAAIIAETYTEIGSDILWTASGCNNLVVRALGGKVRFDEVGVAPEIEEPLLKKAAEVDELEIGRLDSDENIGKILEVTRLLVKNVGNDFLIGCGQWGPFTLAGQLFGIRMLLRLLMKDPVGLRHVLEVTKEICLRYWQLFLDAGVGLARMSEMAASGDILSAKQFESFVVPADAWLVGAVAGKAPATMLHVCGNTTSFLPLIHEIGVDAISIDSRVPLAEARRILNSQVAFAGNLDPVTVMLEATPEVIGDKVRASVLEAGLDGGYILMPGCDLPPATPIENVKAMVQAAHAIEFPR